MGVGVGIRVGENAGFSVGVAVGVGGNAGIMALRQFVPVHVQFVAMQAI